MKSIRVQNLRCIKDTGNISLKPLTLLVGTNSSGKSSFLRMFPLLRQSVETATAGPILWYGRLVDFGSSLDAIRQDTETWISFEFAFSLTRRFTSDILRSSAHIEENELTLSITLTPKGNGSTRLKKYNIRTNDALCAEIEFSETGAVTKFLANEVDVLAAGPALTALPNAEFFPSIITMDDLLDSSIPVARLTFVPQLIRHSRPIRLEALKSLLKTINPRHGKQYTPQRIALALCRASAPKQALDLVRKITNTSKLWTKGLASISDDSDIAKQLSFWVAINQLPVLLSDADLKISQFFRGVQYLGPVRASAQRYYRVQDRAVQEVDSQGENLPVFLKTLTVHARARPPCG